MLNIVKHESGFNHTVYNRGGSGACGLPQSLPCSKLLNKCGTLENIDCQIEWILDYTDNRYGTPNEAWVFWQDNRWW